MREFGTRVSRLLQVDCVRVQRNVVVAEAASLAAVVAVVAVLVVVVVAFAVAAVVSWFMLRFTEKSKCSVVR